MVYLLHILVECYVFNYVGLNFDTGYCTCIYGPPERTFLFQYLPEKKSKQKELERKSKQ